MDEVARALDGGILAAGAEPLVIRGSDGGDGLVDALAPAFERETRHVVSGPLGVPVEARVGWLDSETAIIESRMVCGLSLVAPAQRDPRLTSTRGLGELIRAVVDGGSRCTYVGLGGSATMDGGVGMARAWGWVPRDPRGGALADGGGALVDLADFAPGRGPGASLVGLADVRNPLTGPTGARVYAAQKGASPGVTEQLATGLDRLAAVAAAGGLGHLALQPGAGAAGGLGFGLTYFGGGTLQSGARWVLERAGLGALLARADVVLCTEGAFDATSLEGKLTGEVLLAAKHAGVRVALLAPRATDVPAGVEIETGGGHWTLAELERRAASAVWRALRTPTAP